MFDWLIVGAGFAGSVLAERLASRTDSPILIIDRRPHIGGNAFDRYDETGAIVPRYGRHVLQTDNAKVLQYLSRFARWHPDDTAPGAGKPDLVGSSADEGGLVPSQGYTGMFDKMLSAPNIKVMLNVNYKEVQDVLPFRRLIYTGSLDEYFDYCYGKLPDWPAPTDDAVPHWASVRELRFANVILRGRSEDEAGYSIDSRALLQRYQDLADAAVDVFFTGRLATYRYCTMDEVVAQSLELFDRINDEASGDASPGGAHVPHVVARAPSEWRARLKSPAE